MELLTGRDLESLVREFGPLPADRAMFLLRQVCHSLAEAHERGLIHRDVKPANIYVCRMGLDYDFVKVLDFGLVKFNDARSRTGETQTLMTAAHTTIGTPAYMAPEIILGQSDVDRRADVYALGCVAYFVLTGQLVFEGSTPMQTLVDHVHATPVPPSAALRAAAFRRSSTRSCWRVWRRIRTSGRRTRRSCSACCRSATPAARGRARARRRGGVCICPTWPAR